MEMRRGWNDGIFKMQTINWVITIVFLILIVLIIGIGVYLEVRTPMNGC